MHAPLACGRRQVVDGFVGQRIRPPPGEMTDERERERDRQIIYIYIYITEREREDII